MSLKQLTEDAPFSYAVTKGGLVRIAFRGKTVLTLKGREGSKFVARVEANGGADAQLVMARATGHFKHGTERVSRRRNKP